MASTSARTAYVLLAAIEEDLRGLIDLHGGEHAPEDLLGAELTTKAVDRRIRDGLQSPVQHGSQLTPYLDFQDGYDVLMRLKHRLPKELLDGLISLRRAVVRVVEVRNRVAHNRPLEVDDLPLVIDFTSDLQKIAADGWTRTRSALRAIEADLSSVFRSSANLISDPDQAVANNLPSPDFDETSLLGRRAERRQVTRALLGAWPVVSILGDGGIGKTALALQVCYDLVQMPECPFEAVVWVTAKNAQLTSQEIVRIENAVEDSLGLFASAAAAVGSGKESASATEDLIEVLDTFPTLLVLDNVETVLDENFATLLRDIPNGSKVLITSRIGVKTENPFKISGLSVDDSVKLMRVLARVRGLDLSALATTEDLANWANQMNCHPAYIKWFMSGLQTGQTPERLLNENGLVLDFCMSNVFEFLGEDSRTALQAMIVVPGSHTVAELAFLTGFDATRIQHVIHELTTTNFVSQVRGGPAGTALEMSDFGRAYLRRTLEIPPAARRQYTEKQRQLYVLGGGIQAAHALDPYAVETIDVRGVGDYSAARHLREALELANQGRYDAGLVLSIEAASLAPGYHEAARVEAYLHQLTANFGEAQEAYSRARDLAPSNPYVAFAFGSFLLRSGFDPAAGVQELQRAATLDPSSSFLQLTISDAHLEAGNYRDAMDAALYAFNATDDLTSERRDSLFVLARASAFAVRELVPIPDWTQIAEVIETLLLVCENADPRNVAFEALDIMLWIEHIAEQGANESPDNYIATRIARMIKQSHELRRRIDASHRDRAVGVVDNIVERGFGFIRSGTTSYYFHASSLSDRRHFDHLTTGSILVFNPGQAEAPGQRPPADSVYWVG